MNINKNIFYCYYLVYKYNSDLPQNRVFENIEQVPRYWLKNNAHEVLIQHLFPSFFVDFSFSESNICTYVYPMYIEIFKAINDYRSRNGTKWQKIQLRHFLPNYLYREWGPPGEQITIALLKYAGKVKYLELQNIYCTANF